MSSSLIRLVEAMESKGIITIHTRKELEKFSQEYAVLDWCIDDVKETAKEDGKELSDEDCIQVLSALESDHDASMGVCWDTIKYQIENLGI